ncbi:MAG: hypothetical protein KDK72_06420 [Chlamydiia bacterium]|nr:hypothetical protein [Chlamydiia bacterium]
MVSNYGTVPVAQPVVNNPGFCASAVKNSKGCVAHTILNNRESQNWTNDNTNPDSGGMLASVTHLINSASHTGRFIACQGSRIAGEHLITTGVTLNRSICKALLAVVKENTAKGKNVDMPFDGCSGVHKFASSCDFFRSLLASVHQLHDEGTRNPLSNHKDFFGENVLSAHLWMIVPETSGLLLTAACETLFQGVESSMLTLGAIAEFEPFCKEACKIIANCCKKGETWCRHSYEDMLKMITLDNVPEKPSIQTVQGDDQTRQFTHTTYGATLFSVPLFLSKVATICERLSKNKLTTRSVEALTLAFNRCAELGKEISHEEAQPHVEGWPETGTFARLCSFSNTMRQLIHRLAEEHIHVEGDNSKQNTANSALNSTSTQLFLSLMSEELLVIHSLIARTSQAHNTGKNTYDFSRRISEGIDLNKTLSAGKSKDGSSNTRNTKEESQEGINQAKGVTKEHEPKKADNFLVSAASELPITAIGATCMSESTLSMALSTEVTNNKITTALHEISNKTVTAPLFLTTEPLKELIKIVKEVCTRDNQEHAAVSDGLNLLSIQFEEIQNRLINRSSDAKTTHATYSASLVALMEPTILTSLSVRSLTLLCRHFEAIREALTHCFNELNKEMALQSEETGKRTDVQKCEVSNTVETVSQSLAAATEVSILELNQSKGDQQPYLMNQEITLSEVQKAISISSSKASEILILLTNNSGNTLRRAEQFRQMSNHCSIDGEACTGKTLSKLIEDPENNWSDNRDSSGLSALSNTTAVISASVIQTLIKLFETAHLLGSAASEALLQALISATHPKDQTLAAIQAWEDRVWVRESHPVGDPSKSVFTEQQNQTTIQIATMIRNLVCSVCIISGTSKREQLEVIPAPEAIKDILKTFGDNTSISKNEEVDITTVLTMMRELTLERQNVMLSELKELVKEAGKRRNVTQKNVDAQMHRTKGWIDGIQRRDSYIADKNEESLRGYVLHILTIAEQLRWAEPGEGRRLTKMEISNIRDLLMQNTGADD